MSTLSPDAVKNETLPVDKMTGGGVVVQMPSVGRRAPKPVEIPTRPPWTPPPPRRAVRAHWIQVEVDRYEVRFGDRVIGFVEVVGSVFVVLSGSRYDRAVEVAQSLLFEHAITTLESRARSD